MKNRVPPQAILFVFLLAFALVASSLSPVAAKQLLTHTDTFALQGRVYDGYPFDQSRPMVRVTVQLYLHVGNGFPDPGTWFADTSTDDNGFYSFTFYDDDLIGYEFVSLREINPAGYSSVDATSVDGAKKTNDWIEFDLPLTGKDLTGNKFWDWLDSRATSTPTATMTEVPPPDTATFTPTHTPSHTPTATGLPLPDTATPTPANTWTPTPTTTGAPPADTSTPTATPTQTAVPPADTSTPTAS